MSGLIGALQMGRGETQPSCKGFFLGRVPNFTTVRYDPEHVKLEDRYLQVPRDEDELEIPTGMEADGQPGSVPFLR